jgi:hypothetical protein
MGGERRENLEIYVARPGEARRIRDRRLSSTTEAISFTFDKRERISESAISARERAQTLA